ncbi:hypothetical protein MCHI_004024, partial [Candidatus Magnetoovum chiemensis]
MQPNGIFSTFSTSTGGQGVLTTSFELEKSVDPNFYRLTSTLGYNFSDRVELSTTIPYLFKAENYRFEDISFGLKHRIIDETKFLPSLGYLLSISPPSDNDDDTTEGRYGGGIILTKKIGPFKASSNLFVFLPDREDLENEIDFLIGTDLSVSHNNNILAELVVKKSHYSTKIDTLEGRLGYRYNPVDFLYTTLGTGYDFKDREPKFRFFLSITVIYPPHRDRVKMIYEEE